MDIVAASLHFLQRTLSGTRDGRYIYFVWTTVGTETVSSYDQFDRRLFRSRVYSIETKGQFDRSKGFDRRVSDDKNWDSFINASTAKLNIFTQIW